MAGASLVVLAQGDWVDAVLIAKTRGLGGLRCAGRRLGRRLGRIAQDLLGGLVLGEQGYRWLDMKAHSAELPRTCRCSP